MGERIGWEVRTYGGDCVTRAAQKRFPKGPRQLHLIHLLIVLPAEAQKGDSRAVECIAVRHSEVKKKDRERKTVI